MRSPWNYRAAFWLVLASATGAAQITSEPGWRTRQPAQWTEEDAQQILARSPWAREIGGGLAGRKTEDQLREGGQMGQPQGVGYDGVDPKGSGLKLSPEMLNVFTGPGGDDRSLRSRNRGIALKVVWESALPVRLAELKTHTIEPPTLDGDGYQIAVYGIPGPEFNKDPKQLGDPLREYAALKREGKKDVKPARVEVFQRQDGIVVVYLFPLSAEISKKDLRVEFDAHIGRIHADHVFDLGQMEILGRLEL
ncbi:MAG TPA: hypothetical protein VK789_22895 [Bryobacteraceae bacterium]|jgi:hypothetical protein|nr:hypothetical protein [Bryobacteraceae bacterium]